MINNSLDNLLLTNIKGEDIILTKQIDKEMLKGLIPESINKKLNELYYNEDIKIIDISGKKGIGKSTIISSWLKYNEIKFAWVGYNGKFIIKYFDQDPEILVFDDVHYACLSELDNILKNNEKLKEFFKLDLFSQKLEIQKNTNILDTIYYYINNSKDKLHKTIYKINSAFPNAEKIFIISDFMIPFLNSLFLSNSLYEPDHHLNISYKVVLDNILNNFEGYHPDWVYIFNVPREISILYNEYKEKLKDLLSNDPAKVFGAIFKNLPNDKLADINSIIERYEEIKKYMIYIGEQYKNDIKILVKEVLSQYLKKPPSRFYLQKIDHDDIFKDNISIYENNIKGEIQKINLKIGPIKVLLEGKKDKIYDEEYLEKGIDKSADKITNNLMKIRKGYIENNLDSEVYKKVIDLISSTIHENYLLFNNVSETRNKEILFRSLEYYKKGDILYNLYLALKNTKNSSYIIPTEEHPIIKLFAPTDIKV